MIIHIFYIKIVCTFRVNDDIINKKLKNGMR